MSNAPHTARRNRSDRRSTLRNQTVSIACLAGVLVGALGLASCETVNDTVNYAVDGLTTPSTPVRKETDAYRKEPEIRVRVQKAAHDSTVAGPVRFVARPAPGARTSRRAAAMPGPLKVSSGDKGVSVVDSAGAVHDFGFGADVEILVSDGTPDGASEAPSESIMLDGKAYPGYVTIHPKWSEDAKSFDVCISMPVEAYLPGVLSKELYKDWPRQTFEAQAVAARTYALFERQRARSEGKPSDVEDTTADQVFGGTSNLTVAVEAVRATRGLVLTDNGKLIRAYFSSQCGGRPASAEEAWPVKRGQDFNKAGPLQAKQRQIYCQRSPLYRWTTTRTADDLNKRLRAWGRGKNNELASFSRLRGVEVKDRNAAGRPDGYILRDENGREYRVTAEELREACNWPVPGLAPITRENRLNSGDVEVTVFANEVRFAGRGFGHGVGLCQWCAKGMAETGMDWRSMVEQFYPGAEVRRLY